MQHHRWAFYFAKPKNALHWGRDMGVQGMLNEYLEGQMFITLCIRRYISKRTCWYLFSSQLLSFLFSEEKHMLWCFLCSNYGLNVSQKNNCSPVAFSHHLLTPLFHLFTALGAVTGWAGLSHPGLNRTFRSPGGTGVSLAAGASLGLWGLQAAQCCSGGWRSVRAKSVQRGKSSALVSWGWSVVHILCVSSIYPTPESLQNSSFWYSLLITWWYRCLGWPPICCLLFPSLNLPRSLTPLYTGSAAHCVAWNTWSIFHGYRKAWLLTGAASAARPELPSSKTLLRTSTEFRGNEKEKGRKALSIPMCVRDAQVRAHSNESLWKSVLDNRGPENFRNNIFITLKNQKTKWFCFFSLLLSLSSNQRTLCNQTLVSAHSSGTQGCHCFSLLQVQPWLLQEDSCVCRKPDSQTQHVLC